MSTQQQKSFAQARALPRRIPRLTLDHLWVLSVLALVWLLISVLPLPPNDLWWHMAAGRITVQEHALIHTNRWAYTLPYDAPYVYQSWLSELALYGLWRIGDVPLLVLGRTLAIVLSYGLVAWHALRRTNDGRATALALFLAVLAGWDNWTLRPQTLALLPGAAFVVVLSEYLHGRVTVRWLAALPLLMIIWVNMHGSFVLGIGLVGLAWLATISDILKPIKRPLQTENPEPKVQSLAPTHALTALTLAGAATLLATLVNPLGIGIIGYVQNMLGNPPLQKYFVEWQPPRNEFGIGNSGFWFFAILLLLAALMARGARRPSATELCWYIGLAWLTIGGLRYVMWFALLTLPLLADQLAGLFRARAPRASAPLFSAVYGTLLVSLLVATLPWFAPAHYLGAGAKGMFATSGPYQLLLSNTNPIAATEWLAQHPIQGRFWTNMSYTSYTIWRIPDKQVFADLRVELFPDAVWQNYFAIGNGTDSGIQLLDQWQITHIMLDSEWDRNLYQKLRASPAWCEQFKNGRAVILARCSASVVPTHP